MLFCALQQCWWKSADLHTRGWTKTLNRHLHKICALVDYSKSVWNGQGCQALTTLWLRMMHGGSLSTFAFSVYNVKILHVLFAKMPTSSLFDTSRLLRVKLFVGQCQQWIRCVIVYNISIACLYLREATVHAVSNVDGISQQAWQIEMEPQTVWPLWLGGMSNGWIATLGISHAGRNKVSAQNRWLERWEYWVGLYILRNMCMGMTIPYWCCIVRFVSLAWGHCEMMQKIGLHLVFVAALRANPYFSKRHPMPHISGETQSQRCISK